MQPTSPPTLQRASQPVTAGCRVRSSRLEGGTQVPAHEHADAQLVFALQGVMQVHTGDAQWTIPPQRALWMPAGRRHAIRLLSRTEMRSVYFAPALLGAASGFRRSADVHVITASPLVRELVAGLFVRQRAAAMRAQMASLLLHALDESPCLPTQLPLPTSPRACRRRWPAWRWTSADACRWATRRRARRCRSAASAATSAPSWA